MKILQIISTSASNGAEHHVLYLSQLLKNQGHEVKVLCPEGWLTDQLKKLNLPFTIWIQSKPDIFNDYKTVKDIMKNKFDIIHTHLTRATYIGTYIAWKYKIPLITTLHINSIDPIYKFIAKLSHSIICISKHNYQLMIDKKINTKCVQLIPNFILRIPKNDFNKHNFLKEYNFSQSNFLILIAGKLTLIKGHDLAIEALEKLKNIYPKVHLIVAGNGTKEMLTNLQQKSKLLNVEDKVSFIGFQENILEWMQAADVLWIPSITESFSLAALESLTCGLPIIAGDVGALSEIVINNETGYTVPRDPNAFAEATLKLIKDPNLLKTMEKNAIQTAHEKFSAEKMITQIENLYKSKI